MTNNTLNAGQRRAKYTKYALWLTVFMCAALLTTYVGFREYLRYNMNGMICFKKTPAEFEKGMANLLAERPYKAKLNEKTVPVRFHFNFSPVKVKDALLVVSSSKSNSLNSIIYLGAYDKATFVIEAGEDLLRNGGMDDFEINLFNKETLEVCLAANQSIPAWQANKTVHFDLLPSRDVDKRNGLPISFSVRVE